MNETIFQGESLEEALTKAAETLGVPPEALEHEVTEEKNGGFWGLDETYVRVRAWKRPDEPPPQEAVPEPDHGATDAPAEKQTPLTGERETAAEPREEEQPIKARCGDTAGGFWDGVDESHAEARSEEDWLDDGPEGTAMGQGEPGPEPPVGARETVPTATRREVHAEDEVPASSEFDADASEEIQALVAKILKGMSFDCTVKVHAEDEVYMAMVGGTDKELLLDGNGRPLSALELILNHAFRHRLSARRKIRVDAGDFRSRREDELRDLAFQVAHSAKETGRTQETQPLNPYERRLVHLALAEDSEVTTRSRGSGFLKNVQVIPRRGGRGNR